MFDLVYTDKNHVDQGVLQAYSLDAAWGADENDFQITVAADQVLDFGALVFVDGTQLGGVVDTKAPDGTSDVSFVTYTGRTWHGILGYSVIEPNAGSDYLYYSGDANDVIRTIISRQGLGDIFECRGMSGINVSGRFDRYVNAYDGLMKMLSKNADRQARLAFVKEPGGKCLITAVESARKTDEVDSDRYGFKSTIDSRPVNHLICLGEGDLKDRDVVHLYADKDGNVSTTQTLFGIDEKTETYDYSNAEHDELISKGIERLTELQQTSGVEMTLVEDDGTFEVGDIVGALDNLSGLYVESLVTKVIVNVDEYGFATFSYEVGSTTTASVGSGSGGGVSMTTLQSQLSNFATKAQLGDYVSKSGDTMTGKLTFSGVTGQDVIKVSHGVANAESMARFERTDTNKAVRVGIGSGGQNRGLYDSNGDKWMIWADESNLTHMSPYIVGQRETTSAPSGLVTKDRIVITPTYHTGGPWKITSMDDASASYIRFAYGNTPYIISMKHDGGTAVLGSFSSGGTISSALSVVAGTFGDTSAERQVQANAGAGRIYLSRKPQRRLTVASTLQRQTVAIGRFSQ